MQGDLANHSKIVRLVGLLKGRALTWAKAIWEKGGEPVSNYNYTLFPCSLSEIKTDPAKQADWRVVELALDFCMRAAESGWNKLALIAAFRHGLNEDMLTELASWDDEATLDLLTDLATHIDNLLSE